VDGDAETGGRGGRARGPARHEAERMPGMQAREHRPLEAPLQLHALRVHRDVDDAVAGRHDRQRDHQGRQAGRGGDRHQRGGIDGEAGPEARWAAEPRDQRRAGRQPGDGARFEADDGDRELPG
jgi:hypothetical protein